MVYRQVFRKAVDIFTETFRSQYEKGIAKYKVELTTFNGRDSASDLFEEMVDAFQYATQLKMERDDLCKIIYRGMSLDELPDYVQKYIERHGK